MIYLHSRHLHVRLHSRHHHSRRLHGHHRIHHDRLGIKVLKFEVDQKITIHQKTIKIESCSKFEGLCCTSSTSATASLTGLSLIDLDLLAIDGRPIHLADSGVGGLLLVERYEGIAFASVVDVRHSAELLELGLKSYHQAYNKSYQGEIVKIFIKLTPSKSHKSCHYRIRTKLK